MGRGDVCDCGTPPSQVCDYGTCVTMGRGEVWDCGR